MPLFVCLLFGFENGDLPPKRYCCSYSGGYLMQSILYGIFYQLQLNEYANNLQYIQLSFIQI